VVGWRGTQRERREASRAAFQPRKREWPAGRLVLGCGVRKSHRPKQRGRERNLSSFLFLFLKLNFPNIFSEAFEFSLSFSLKPINTEINIQQHVCRNMFLTL
jgi:hypothetical protein